MDKTARLYKHQQGSAATELVVGCLAAIPLFLAVSLLGKYADMRHKTVEAARYVAWEEVIHDGNGSTGDYAYEATDRFMGHREAPVVDTDVIKREGVTEDPLWRDYTTRTLMVSDGSTVRVNVKQTNPASRTRHQGLVRRYAGVADLKTDMLTGYNVELPFTNRARAPKAGQNTTLASFFDPNHYIPPEKLKFTATSAILIDPWNAPSHNLYKARTRKLVSTTEAALTLAQVPSLPLSFIPLFKEFRHAQNPDLVAPTEALLSKYKGAE